MTMLLLKAILAHPVAAGVAAAGVGAWWLLLSEEDQEHLKKEFERSGHHLHHMLK
jgi:hypothetical protein